MRETYVLAPYSAPLSGKTKPAFGDKAKRRRESNAVN
jgi:hypothetical protein